MLQKEQVLLREFYDAARLLTKQQPLLDVAAVQDKEDLQKRRDLVQRFIAANSGMGKFYREVEHDYKDGMEKQGVSQATITTNVEGLHKKMQASPKGVEDIWAANAIWAESELDALDFLTTKWGKWSYQSSAKKAVFEETADAEEFSGLVRDVNRAYRERKRIQDEISKGK